MEIRRTSGNDVGSEGGKLSKLLDSLRSAAVMDREFPPFCVDEAMNICLVTLRHPFAEADYGGIESHVGHLAIALRSLGHKVCVVTSALRRQEDREYYNGVRVISTRTESNNLFLRSILFGWKAAAILRSLDSKGVEIINGQAGLSLPLAVLVRSSAAKILTIHTGDHLNLAVLKDLERLQRRTGFYRLRYYALRLWRSRYLKAADAYVFVSPWVVQEMLGSYPFLQKRVFCVIRNGSPSATGLDALEKSYDIACVGRLSSPKGVDVLIRAIALLRNQGFSAKTVIAGSGDFGNDLRLLVRRLSLEGEIDFRDGLNPRKAAGLIARSRYLILPSFYESDPLVVREARAAGVPVVASDIPQLKEIVENGKSGLLFAAGNAANLAETLKVALENDPVTYDGMRAFLLSQNPRTWTDVAKEFISFYECVLRLRRRNPDAG